MEALQYTRQRRCDVVAFVVAVMLPLGSRNTSPREREAECRARKCRGPIMIAAPTPRFRTLATRAIPDPLHRHTRHLSSNLPSSIPFSPHHIHTHPSHPSLPTGGKTRHNQASGHVTRCTKRANTLSHGLAWRPIRSRQRRCWVVGR